MTDTPIHAQTFPPVPTSERVKAFIGDLARPFAVMATSGAAAAAIVIIAQKTTSGDGAVFVAAVFAGVGAIYGAKSWETAVQAKQDAQVKIAQANASPAAPVQ